MTKSEVMKALPQQCQLRAQVAISDMQLSFGMPERVIKDQLSRELGRHLGEKSSTFIKREDKGFSRDTFPSFYAPYSTTYTAEVFVFSEKELIEFAETMMREGATIRKDSEVAIEVSLKVATVKSELKKKLKATIDKAID